MAAVETGAMLHCGAHRKLLLLEWRDESVAWGSAHRDDAAVQERERQMAMVAAHGWVAWCVFHNDAAV